MEKPGMHKKPEESASQKRPNYLMEESSQTTGTTSSEERTKSPLHASTEASSGEQPVAKKRRDISPKDKQSLSTMDSIDTFFQRTFANRITEGETPEIKPEEQENIPVSPGKKQKNLPTRQSPLSSYVESDDDFLDDDNQMPLFAPLGETHHKRPAESHQEFYIEFNPSEYDQYKEDLQKDYDQLIGQDNQENNEDRQAEADKISRRIDAINDYADIHRKLAGVFEQFRSLQEEMQENRPGNPPSESTTREQRKLIIKEGQDLGLYQPLTWYQQLKEKEQKSIEQHEIYQSDLEAEQAQSPSSFTKHQELYSTQSSIQKSKKHLQDIEKSIEILKQEGGNTETSHELAMMEFELAYMSTGSNETEQPYPEKLKEINTNIVSINRQYEQLKRNERDIVRTASTSAQGEENEEKLSKISTEIRELHDHGKKLVTHRQRIGEEIERLRKEDESLRGHLSFYKDYRARAYTLRETLQSKTNETGLLQDIQQAADKHQQSNLEWNGEEISDLHILHGTLNQKIENWIDYLTETEINPLTKRCEAASINSFNYHDYHIFLHHYSSTIRERQDCPWRPPAAEYQGDCGFKAMVELMGQIDPKWYQPEGVQRIYDSGSQREKNYGLRPHVTIDKTNTLLEQEHLPIRYRLVEIPNEITPELMLQEQHHLYTAADSREVKLPLFVGMNNRAAFGSIFGHITVMQKAEQTRQGDEMILYNQREVHTIPIRDIFAYDKRITSIGIPYFIE